MQLTVSMHGMFLVCLRVRNCGSMCHTHTVFESNEEKNGTTLCDGRQRILKAMINRRTDQIGRWNWCRLRAV